LPFFFLLGDPSQSISAIDLLNFLFSSAADVVSSFNQNSPRSHSPTPFAASSRQKLKTMLWDDFWFPILEFISRLCTDPRPAVRGHSLSTLQHSLLSLELRLYIVAIPPSVVTYVFDILGHT
jgi:hypothetical protein